MILRSAAHLQSKTDGSVGVGDFIELRSDDPTSRPWLARVVGTRESAEQGGVSTLTEVECEWLWHPRDTIAELGLTGVDPNIYGSREVFLGDGSRDATRDWNPIESKKWQVHVFPLEQYKAIAASGFQLPAVMCGGGPLGRDSASSGPMVLDPSRCWYYRQTLDTEKHILFPDLERSVHRPNPAFLEWCRVTSTKPECPTSLHLPADAIDPPPRTLCVPENPERLYFCCSACSRRFETRQADCVDLAASLPSVTDEPKGVPRFKSYINQPDVVFLCPMCATLSTTTPQAAVSIVVDTSPVAVEPDPQKQEELRRDEKRKLTRYERFNDVFRRAIEECVAAQVAGMKYSDSRVLCDVFFEQFEDYASRVQLSGKMAHQKMHEIFQNLKRENNVNLRRRIVTGELPLDELLRLDAKELAPESLKRRREIEAQKYFKQQVLLSSSPSGPKLIRKTHKGLEAVIDDDEGTSVSPLRSQSPLQSSESLPVHDGFFAHSIDSAKKGPSSIQPFAPGAFGAPQTALYNDHSSTRLRASELMERIRTQCSRRGPPDSELVDLPVPLLSLWHQTTRASKDPQLAPPPATSGIPSRAQTMDVLKARFVSVAGHEKLLSDMIRYSQLEGSETTTVLPDVAG